MIDDARLDELEKLADEATSGPWKTQMRDRVTADWIDKWTDDDGTVYRDEPFVCATDSFMEETQHPEEDEANAAFIAAARAAVPELIESLRSVRAQLAAVEKLHQPEKRWHDGSGEWSVDTAQEVVDGWDIPLEQVEYFEVCAECGKVEAEFMAETGGDWSYREGLWPCDTRRALESGDAEETQ